MDCLACWDSISACRRHVSESCPKSAVTVFRSGRRLSIHISFLWKEQSNQSFTIAVHRFSIENSPRNGYYHFTERFHVTILLLASGKRFLCGDNKLLSSPDKDTMRGWPCLSNDVLFDEKNEAGGLYTHAKKSILLASVKCTLNIGLEMVQWLFVWLPFLPLCLCKMEDFHRLRPFLWSTSSFVHTSLCKDRTRCAVFYRL